MSNSTVSEILLVGVPPEWQSQMATRLENEQFTTLFSLSKNDATKIIQSHELCAVIIDGDPQAVGSLIGSDPHFSSLGNIAKRVAKQISDDLLKALRIDHRGQIIGDQSGLLKLIFHLDTHELLGVHIIGEGASGLVHIGQAVMAFKGRVEYFINNAFNYPTLSECYKTAAFDDINRLRA